MSKFKVYENEFGFYIDYIYSENNNKKCLRLCEDNDYFSFTVFSPDSKMLGSQVIKIDNANPIFLPFMRLLNNVSFVEILEEGTDEGKTISFKNNNNSIDIIFSLNKNPVNVTSVSITNVRLASPNVTFGSDSPVIDDFKNKLHYSLLEIKDNLKEYSM